MKIKTYPLQFTEEYLREIEKKAKENNMSIKEFILNAIQEKLERKKENNLDLIKNKNVILIDDIFTTGSTANEISKLLKLNSVNNIYIFTLLTTYVESYTKE